MYRIKYHSRHYQHFSDLCRTWSQTQCMSPFAFPGLILCLVGRTLGVDYWEEPGLVRVVELQPFQTNLFPDRVAFPCFPDLFLQFRNVIRCESGIFGGIWYQELPQSLTKSLGQPRLSGSAFLIHGRCVIE